MLHFSTDRPLHGSATRGGFEVGMSEETMRAVVCHGPYGYRLEDVSRPRAGAGEVVVEVGAVGICGSDVKCFTGSAKF